MRILNKIDLGNVSTNADVFISAKTGEGNNNLFSLLKQTAIGSNNYSEKSAIVSNLRHYNCLKKAKSELENALKSIDLKMSGEFISVDLRNAEIYLGEIIGEVTSEDILNNIFMSFCIGK